MDSSYLNISSGALQLSINQVSPNFSHSAIHSAVPNSNSDSLIRWLG